MSELSDILTAEGDAAEASELAEKERGKTAHQTRRGHDHATTLRVHLHEDELAELNVLAARQGLPASTVARQLLLQSLAKGEDLATAFDELELSLAAVRQLALGPQPHSSASITRPYKSVDDERAHANADELIRLGQEMGS